MHLQDLFREICKRRISWISDDTRPDAGITIKHYFPSQLRLYTSILLLLLCSLSFGVGINDRLVDHSLR
ncbi:predicted protein [Lichtheimia corymbifera JMRC:FSU:9682]|uniref:Uncharacterized protein n=1 Tax=Lichtheimia corymbifera JMRC:FSU:9682 TaxID=1263082 RepID=A0A068RH73_9FUNG|nr:predicted protein [Lichtheimia corymbifera JMRC:FSU:9682]